MEEFLQKKRQAREKRRKKKLVKSGIIEESESSTSEEEEIVHQDKKRKLEETKSEPLKRDLKVMLTEVIDLLEDFEDKSGKQRAALFMKLPNKQDYPDYYKVIKKPMSFNEVKVFFFLFLKLLHCSIFF